MQQEFQYRLVQQFGFGGYQLGVLFDLYFPHQNPNKKQYYLKQALFAYYKNNVHLAYVAVCSLQPSREIKRVFKEVFFSNFLLKKYAPFQKIELAFLQLNFIRHNPARVEGAYHSFQVNKAFSRMLSDEYVKIMTDPERYPTFFLIALRLMCLLQKDSKDSNKIKKTRRFVQYTSALADSSPKRLQNILQNKNSKS